MDINVKTIQIVEVENIQMGWMCLEYIKND